MMNDHLFELRNLRRSPDVEAANLFAWDASDSLLLDEVANYLPGLDQPDEQVVVLNDSYGALTLGLAARLGIRTPRVHQDLVTGEQALRNNLARLQINARPRQLPMLDGGGEALLRGAGLVLLKLPRGLAELEQIAQTIARHAGPDAVLLAAGRVKHMSLTMNAVLEKYFRSVEASLARQKSRLLTAARPELPTDAATFPIAGTVQPASGPKLEVRAHGAAFAGASLDVGTRFLLENLRQEDLPQTGTIVDLGCGTGLIASMVGLLRPTARIIAADRSEAAISSARATALANRVSQVELVRDDAGASLPDGEADLILLNPPFHSGAAIHPGVALKLFRSAARLLRPGAKLLTVYNRHLDYQRSLEKMVGPSRIMAQNPKFIVLESRRRS